MALALPKLPKLFGFSWEKPSGIKLPGLPVVPVHQQPAITPDQPPAYNNPNAPVRVVPTGRVRVIGPATGQTGDYVVLLSDVKVVAPAGQVTSPNDESGIPIAGQKGTIGVAGYNPDNGMYAVYPYGPISWDAIGRDQNPDPPSVAPKYNVGDVVNFEMQDEAGNVIIIKGKIDWRRWFQGPQKSGAWFYSYTYQSGPQTGARITRPL